MNDSGGGEIALKATKESPNAVGQ